MNLFYKVSWLQRMYNYLYSLYKGAVRTVNGTPPDANGNVDVSGGGSDSVAGSGVYISGNTLNVGANPNTFTEGLLTQDLYLIKGDPTAGDYATLLIGGPNGTVGLDTVKGTNSQSIELQKEANLVQIVNGVDGNSSRVVFNPDLSITINSSLNSFGGIQYGNDFSANYTDRSLVDKASVAPVVEHPYKGGQSPFTADGTTTVFDITHNLGATPSFFTLTTTQPIAQNHLGRTITFPNPNTMRLTFAFAPNPGEDANYVWIVYK